MDPIEVTRTTLEHYESKLKATAERSLSELSKAPTATQIPPGMATSNSPTLATGTEPLSDGF